MRSLQLRCAALLAVAALAAAVPAAAPAAGPSEDGLWAEVGPTRAGVAALRGSRARRSFRLDDARLRQLLREAPLEFSGAAPVEMTLPLPDGSYTRVRIEESPILSPELQEESPDLRSYRAQGVDDPSASGRLDRTPAGFHAMLITARGTLYVDPSDPLGYASYWQEDAPAERFRCGAQGSAEVAQAAATASFAATKPSGDRLRTYRLAVSANSGYTQSLGGEAEARAAIATDVNRVAAIFEREIAISLLLTATNIYADPATDPFGAEVALGANQRDLDAKVGDANYDIGHLFARVGGGSFGVGIQGTVCKSGRKALGYSSSFQPTGPGFVTLVSHEMGHQLSAFHTFNATCSSGGSGRGYEPGSGSTIMAYAGWCPPRQQAVQARNDDYFHTWSYEEIAGFRDGPGACGLLDATGNRPPTVDAGPGCTIPTGTPFRLTAIGEDADGDPLTFGWEQFDRGNAEGIPRPTFTSGPLFRSRPATASPTRTFPRLEDILSGAPTPWEVLPGVSRTLNFRVTVRDNRAGGGGVDYDSTTVTAAGPPFACTAPRAGASLECGGQTTVEWTVGGGAVSPDVGIQFSSDGGASFAPLVGPTPNDGSQAVRVPAEPTTRGRFLVEAASECFFSVSGAFSVVDTTAPTLRAPADAVAECASPAGTPVALGAPWASDACDGAIEAVHDGPALYPVGDTAVTWTAADDSGHGATDVQTVSVRDTLPPEISCRAPGAILRRDAPVAFTAAAVDRCDGAASVRVADFACFRLTKSGKRIDKSRSCAVELAGDTARILDVGSVGDTIEWTLSSTDASGNRSEATCAVLVVPPGRAPDSADPSHP